MTVSVKWRKVNYKIKLFKKIVEGFIDEKWFWSLEKHGKTFNVE